MAIAVEGKPMGRCIEEMIEKNRDSIITTYCETSRRNSLSERFRGGIPAPMVPLAALLTRLLLRGRSGARQSAAGPRAPAMMRAASWISAAEPARSPTSFSVSARLKLNEARNRRPTKRLPVAGLRSGRWSVLMSGFIPAASRFNPPAAPAGAGWVSVLSSSPSRPLYQKS